MKKYHDWLYRFAENNNLGKDKTVDGVTYHNCYDFGRQFIGKDGKQILVGFWFAGEYDETCEGGRSLQIGHNWRDRNDQRLFAGNDRAVAFLRSWFPGAEIVCCFKKEQQTVQKVVKAAALDG